MHSKKESMPILEDSGIDSEDKLSTVFEDAHTAPAHKSTTSTTVSAQHMADLEVAFKGAGAGSSTSELSYAKHRETVAAAAPDSDDGAVAVVRAPPNSCRILQRKLELKVERAKRNYSQYQEDHARKSQSANLIPINRLPIPGDVEQKPLVDYKSDSSDDPEEISFFPAKLRNARKHKQPELSDTFSIQEMTIDSDLDSDESGTSQNLELLPPGMKANMLDKFRSCFGCAYAS